MIRLILLLFTSLLTFPTFYCLDDLSEAFKNLKDSGINTRLLEAIHRGDFSGYDLLSVEDITFGIDSNDEAWFWFSDEFGHEFAYNGLQRNNDLVSEIGKSHKLSEVFHLVDDEFLISLLIHDQDESEVSLSVFSQKTGLPTFHLTTHSQIKHSDFTQGRRLMNGKTSKTNHFVAYEYHETFAQGSCGAMVVDTTGGRYHEIPIDDFDFEKNEEIIRDAKSKRKLENEQVLHEESSRHLLPQFFECGIINAAVRLLDVSFIADLGYFKSYGSNVDAVVRSVEIIVANTNLIYFFQFNVKVRLQQLLIVTRNIGNAIRMCELGGTATFVRDILSQDSTGGTCCGEIRSVQDKFKAFSKSAQSGKPSDPSQFIIEIVSDRQIVQGGEHFDAAHWHLLTDCYPADCGEDVCTVGLSLLNQNAAGGRTLACDFRAGRNVGISSRTFQTWLVVAHELGHNFGGASHSFENRQGNTGGLMDYGDGKIGGTYQFNKLRKNEFCASIQTLAINCGFRGDDFFARQDNNPCSGKLEFTRVGNEFDEGIDNCGVCINNECEPLQLLLKVTNNPIIDIPDLFDKDFLIEPSEFSPLTTKREDTLVATLIESDPLIACSELNSTIDFSGKIVIVQRGGCRFTEKATNVVNAGAAAMIVFNNVDGAPKVLGGDGFFDFVAVSVSRKDGLELLKLIEESESEVRGALGGFAKTDLVLDFVPEPFYIEYQLPILASVGLALPLIALYFVISKFQKIKKAAKKTSENIYDAAIDGKYYALLAAERAAGRLGMNSKYKRVEEDIEDEV